jgi:hypothetical protein
MTISLVRLLQVKRNLTLALKAGTWIQKQKKYKKK